jgi:hypothetical protein
VVEEEEAQEVMEVPVSSLFGSLKDYNLYTA